LFYFLANKFNKFEIIYLSYSFSRKILLFPNIVFFRVVGAGQKRQLAIEDLSNAKKACVEEKVIGKKHVQYIGISYEMFHYGAFDNAISGGNFDTLLYQKFIRGTIDLMISTSQSSAGRYPKPHELEEMAKSIVLKYPLLKDDVLIHVRLCVVFNYYQFHMTKNAM